MDKKKQIEEMEKIVSMDCDDIKKSLGITSCEGVGCYICLARLFYAKGYRKASEVAREIFEDIGKILRRFDEIAERDKSEYGELIVGDITANIAELKKKYTEEGK